MKHWRHYLIEAWGLGTFMFVAGGIAVLLARAPEPLHAAFVAYPMLERCLFGCAMGATAMGIVYSRWGARSGAHLNPALTLTFAFLRKIAPADAAAYAIAQFVGGALGLGAIAALAGHAFTDAPVDAIVTRPGPLGPGVAFAAEVAMAFVLMSVILVVSNAAPRVARFTGVAAALCVAAFITFEAPLSGMSLNPARTAASAFVARDATAIWIYFLAPLAGMLAAAALFVRTRGLAAVHCARLNHSERVACIFRCGYGDLTAPTSQRCPIAR